MSRKKNEKYFFVCLFSRKAEPPLVNRFRSADRGFVRVLHPGLVDGVERVEVAIQNGSGRLHLIAGGNPSPAIPRRSR